MSSTSTPATSAVSGSPTCATAPPTLPEYTFALILALRRGLVGYRQDVIYGRWQQENQFCFATHPNTHLAGPVLGIIAGCALGQAFGMRTLFAAHKDDEALTPLFIPVR